MKQEINSNYFTKVNLKEGKAPLNRIIEEEKDEANNHNKKQCITGNDMLNKMFEHKDKSNVTDAIDAKDRQVFESGVNKMDGNLPKKVKGTSKESNTAGRLENKILPVEVSIKQTVDLTKTEPFLFSNIIERSELNREQLEVYNTEILKNYRANTLVFMSRKNWTAKDAKVFLKKVNKNDEDLDDLFNIINNELREDLIECEEDLKIINEEIQMWQIAGISIDINRTQVKIEQAISWINSKKAQVQSSIEQFSVTTNNIKNNINQYYLEKENAPS